mgnify:CR=1 FL=1
MGRIKSRFLNSLPPLAGAIFLNAASFAGASEHETFFWSHVDLDGGAAANYAACEECDDLALAIYCADNDSRLLIDVFMDIKQGEDLDTADAAFRIDDKEAVIRESYLELNLMDDILQPVIETAIDDPIVAAMSVGKALTVTVRGQSMDISLEGARDAIQGMFEACGVELVLPEPETTPEESADPAAGNSG